MPISGHFFDYIAAYLSGVAVSFTPCIYPVIPVVAGAIGGVNAEGAKGKGFLLSLVYVLGLAIVYCLLAVFASLTGKVFGQWQSQPVILFFPSIILFLFALVMLDVINLPALGVAFHHKIKINSALEVLLLGMASGILVSPCTAPFLGTLLLYVASKKNLIHSVSLVFVFAYGVGTSLIIVGTFSGLLAHLPKSGRWMHRIKIFFGGILLAVAVFIFFKALGGLF
ncbi:MAG: sulfite exporter TauE/SafE family protein [Candidatus Omnitrophica bacterium]|nr:sulfite exporter TauE/SafE family protein [Candidatus Omnitrophota bacterium]